MIVPDSHPTKWMSIHYLTLVQHQNNLIVIEDSLFPFRTIWQGVRKCWCAGKPVFRGGMPAGGDPWFVAFADFYGVRFPLQLIASYPWFNNWLATFLDISHSALQQWHDRWMIHRLWSSDHLRILFKFSHLGQGDLRPAFSGSSCLCFPPTL